MKKFLSVCLILVLFATALCACGTVTPPETMQFGYYPQSLVTDTQLIYELNVSIGNGSAQIDPLTGYISHGGKLYAAVEYPEPYSVRSTFLSGERIDELETYYFVVEPVSWIILDKNNGQITLMAEKLLSPALFARSRLGANLSVVTFNPSGRAAFSGFYSVGMLYADLSAFGAGKVCALENMGDSIKYEFTAQGGSFFGDVSALSASLTLKNGSEIILPYINSNPMFTLYFDGKILSGAQSTYEEEDGKLLLDLTALCGSGGVVTLTREWGMDRYTGKDFQGNEVVLSLTSQQGRTLYTLDFGAARAEFNQSGEYRSFSNDKYTTGLEGGWTLYVYSDNTYSLVQAGIEPISGTANQVGRKLLYATTIDGKITEITLGTSDFDLTVIGTDGKTVAEAAGTFTQSYQTVSGSAWEYSSVRIFLNNSFYFGCFSASERAKLLPAAGGDFVNLLTLENAINASYGFGARSKSDPLRKAFVTDYALCVGAYAQKSGASAWWLVTPADSGTVAGVSKAGKIDKDVYVDYDLRCVRPIITIKGS